MIHKFYYLSFVFLVTSFAWAFPIKAQTTSSTPSSFVDLTVTGTLTGSTALFTSVGIGTAAPSEQLEITGNFKLPITTATSGIVYTGSVPFIHNYGDAASSGNNVFIGPNAGNFTMGPSGGPAWFASYNSAGGSGAFGSNTTGWNNAAFGGLALAANTSGNRHAAFGFGALRRNTIGEANTAVGQDSLTFLTEGSHNVAVGSQALYSATIQGDNTAIGAGSLYHAVTAGVAGGDTNSALGSGTLYVLTTGYQNTAVGYQAGWGDGYSHVNTGSLTDYNMTFAGTFSSRDASVPQTTTLFNSTALGFSATVDASNKMTFGSPLVTSFQLGSNGTSISSKTLTVGPLTGTNLTGSSLTIQPGNGTGTGGSGQLLFQTAPTGSTGATANTFTTRVAITNAGNVGIGTVNPTTKLEIKGTGNTGATNSFLIKNSDGNPELQVSDVISGSTPSVSVRSGIAFFGNATKILGGTGDGISFFHGATEGMRLNKNGLVGIGTTNPGQQLTVAGSVGFPGIGNGAGTAYICTTLATGVISTSTGTCTASSRKYKDNIQNLSYGLEDVLRLRPVSFDYKPGLLVPGHQIGFIAEEVYDIVPEIVGLKDGEPDNVDYAKLTSVLIKAVQELNLKISSSTQTIADNLSLIDTLQFAGMELLEHSVRFVEIVADKITATVGIFDNLEIKHQLCVDDVCVNKEQLKSLLLQAGATHIETN